MPEVKRHAYVDDYEPAQIKHALKSILKWTDAMERRSVVLLDIGEVEASNRMKATGALVAGLIDGALAYDTPEDEDGDPPATVTDLAVIRGDRR